MKKTTDEFKIPPVSALIGSTLINYFKVLGKGRVLPKYYIKLLITLIVILIATPFHLWEELVFHRKLLKFKFKKPPLFIIGHWRSGTTLLHNLLCQDPSAGYMTTYQSVFPNNLSSKWLFRSFMKLKMPRKRPADNVELNVNFPQEDEFAFSNCQPYAYYNFFYFPTLYQNFYKQAIKHEGLTKSEIDTWYYTYDKMLKKALINTKAERLVIKNPVNTARIDKILRLYPDAKFIYIYRNPFTVFYSTQRFFQMLFPTICLQKFSAAEINDLIFDVYKKIMSDYSDKKSLIPPENILELRYEDFEKNPLEEIQKIYTELLEEDFNSVQHYFKKYMSTVLDYRKNKYVPDEKMIAHIRKHWGKYIDLYKYDIP